MRAPTGISGPSVDDEVGHGEVFEPDEKYECAEMLEFVADWLLAEPRLTRAALTSFVPGYDIVELRWALMHFARRLVETRP